MTLPSASKTFWTDKFSKGAVPVVCDGDHGGESGHFIIIDRLDVVIDAVSQLVQSVRNNAKL